MKTEGGPERSCDSQAFISKATGFFHYTAESKTKGKNLYHLDKNLFPFLLKKFLYQYIFKRISSKKAIKITLNYFIFILINLQLFVDFGFIQLNSVFLILYYLLGKHFLPVILYKGQCYTLSFLYDFPSMMFTEHSWLQ